MNPPTFSLFETICDELRLRDEVIISETIFSRDILDELCDEYAESSPFRAIHKAVDELTKHFALRQSSLPFGFDPKAMRFWAEDRAFIQFISDVASIRGRPLPEAREFEIATCRQLEKRLSGLLHHVGAPRKLKRTVQEFSLHLQELGFDKNVLDPHDQDGGLDILWFPPLGAIPIRPMVSVQCKNSSFNREDATNSAGQAVRTIERHSHMRGAGKYICCVVFNDYIDRTFLGRSTGWIFVPLGLSDLAPIRQTVQAVYL